MKESLLYLPERKRSELEKLTSVIAEMIEPDFVVLFGSYARGDWVEDKSIGDDGNLYEYRSDYDILVVVKNPRRYEKGNFVEKIEKKARQQGVRTDISMIFHSPAEFKRAVNKGKYFFVDIVKEGVMLHSSGHIPLPEIHELSSEERRYYAQKYFDNWFESAKGFYRFFEVGLEENNLSGAAFQLHQAAECFYATALLVFTGYKPKLHDLEKLDARVRILGEEFKNIFPRNTEKEKDLFDMLKRAYVEARYSMSYKIGKDELEYLASRVKLLQTAVEKACKEKILRSYQLITRDCNFTML